MRLTIFLTLLAILFSSCYSYKIFPEEYRSFSYNGEKKKAFVLNPGLSKEFRILQKAGIFQLTTDSLDTSVTRIKLYSLEKHFACGEPVLLSWFTLGQVPVFFPDRYDYTFDEIQRTDTIQKAFELRVAMRYWFWDIFRFHKKFQQKAGQTLLANYYNNSPTLHSTNRESTATLEHK